jgi:hypothetical protein
MKKTVLFLGMLLINLHLFSQNVNVDKIKQENLKLKNQVSVLQNDNDSIRKQVVALKQDTMFLRSKLAYFDKLNSNVDFSLSSFSSQFVIKVLNCSGDRGAQTVKIEFIIHHKKANQKVQMGSFDLTSTAYDEIGNSFLVKEITFGTESSIYPITLNVPTDIDLRASITFRGIIGGTDKLKLVQIFAKSEDADGGQNKIGGKIDIRNIKINWL